jgi:hypothetical protein
LVDSDYLRKSGATAGSSLAENSSFYILNYSTSDFRQKFKGKYKMDKVRLNFAPHAFIFHNCNGGEDRKVHIHAAVYTQWQTDKA